MIDQSLDPSFIPITPNPFIVGNPVRDRSMFFGREAEFEMVRNRFQHLARGGLLVFCGERRSGKTSILFQILDQRLGPDFIPVLIDMQSMAVSNEAEFLTRLCDEILVALGSESGRISAPSFAQGGNHSATFQKFIWNVLHAHPGKKLILLFDEYELFETKIDAGSMSDDVLHVLSSLMENAPVFLVFTGSQHLEQRRQEYWKILGKSIHKQISYLEPEDAVKLICKPVDGRVRYAPGAVEAICRLTAGQPFYTQAICQNLVDHLNEEQSNDATEDMVRAVVRGIVDNPLPQMVFLWEALERDEKLVLALLAEALETEAAAASANRLIQIIRRAQYPLELDKARIATVLETLFRSEMLLRDDTANPGTYSFRMDLWRQWIRRQHSVWQVMRELGLEIRAPKEKWRQTIMVGGGVGLAAVIALVAIPAIRRDAVRRAPTDSTRAARFVVEVNPAETRIYMDDHQVGMGRFRDDVAAGQKHQFALRADGYADTTFTRNLAAGASDSLHIRMDPLRGALRVEAQPSGADIHVDGRAMGKSPVTIPDLLVPMPHMIEATLSGYGPAKRTFSVVAGQTTSVVLTLNVGRINVTLETDPPGATIRVDGTSRGTSPLVLNQLQLGKQYEVRANRDGFSQRDTSLVISEQTQMIKMVLLEEPLGVLEVRGDVPAEIFLDEVIIGGNVQNAKREKPGGSYGVHVAFGGRNIDTTVVVKPGQRVIFDYSERTITWKTVGGH